MQTWGAFEQRPDGRFALTFERRLPHPPHAVWRALTERAQLRAWFVQILDYERSRLDFRPGAQLAFVPIDRTLPTGRGLVTQCDPPRLLEYTWDAETLRWQLQPDGERACRLTFTNILGDAATARAVACGWHAGLDVLAATLDGRPAGAADWPALADEYARALG